MARRAGEKLASHIRKRPSGVSKSSPGWSINSGLQDTVSQHSTTRISFPAVAAKWLISSGSLVRTMSPVSDTRWSASTIFTDPRQLFLPIAEVPGMALWQA
jgi:hypothetical protein